MIGQYGTACLSSFWENSKPKENLEIKCLNDEVVHISRAPTCSVHEKMLIGCPPSSIDKCTA